MSEKSHPSESRLKKRSWERRASRVRSSVGRRALSGAEPTLKSTFDTPVGLRTPERSAAYTISPEFGDYGVAVGSLDVDGFHALNSNHSSGMDAFAINPLTRRIMVTDGLGGAGGGRHAETTRRLSKRVAIDAAEQGPDVFIMPESRAAALERFKAENPDVPFDSKIRSPIKGVRTTLSGIEVGEQTDSGTSVRIFTIGDSPVFILDTDGRVKKDELGRAVWYGEDSRSGSSDNPLHNYLGFDSDGSLHDDGLDSGWTTDIEVTIPKGCLVAVGSDYFSDAFLIHGWDDFSPYMDMAGWEFSAEVSGGNKAKADDATLVIVDPHVMAR